MFSEKILALTRQLYPTGRAFKMPFNGFLEKLHIGLALSEARFYDDAISILGDILPDNANFGEDDATDWERRLGLITNISVPLADRKLAILRKINFPGVVPARQSHLFLQKQLQDAGFNVFVYENRFPDYPSGYVTKTPEELYAGSFITSINHGQFNHGQFNHGGVYNNLIVNHIDESLDFGFSIGDNLRSTFFIGGATIGTYADVDVNRKNEFRQLILRVKPAQMVGFLFINYV
jgi:uncharacterized protein YmfQ (DUF2313 family)